MKLLLVGATGQIGTALTMRLAQGEHSLRILVRRAPSPPPPRNVEILERGKFTPAAFAEALADIDLAIYGVGLPEQYAASDDVFDRINRELFESFLGQLERTEIRRLVYISTYEVFEAQDGVIRESHPITDPADFSPYFQAMIAGYEKALEFADRTGVQLTTIHPAAVYGGRNTSWGVTNFVENIVRWKVWNVPVAPPSRFPVVHADNLADAIERSLEHTGPFIVSDEMTSLWQLSGKVRQHARCYRPPVLPLFISGTAIRMMEAGARRFGLRPIMSDSQVKFLTAGYEPRADRAVEQLGWNPWSLEKGLEVYFAQRR